MSNLRSWFEKGMTHDDYVTSMTVHKENLQKVYDEYSVSEGSKLSLSKLKDRNIAAIVLTADWCGDAMMNVPIFKKLGDIAGIEPRYLIRDENLELMDQYLTNGTARSIPIFIFIDENGHEIGKWGPRAPEVQSVVEEIKTGMPDKEDPAFKEAFKAFVEKISALFTTDLELWSAVEKDMVHTLTEMK
ncbi:thioredoxin family protein [Peribacillus alkalitolerans]|uniref:thioredoxin family protein n=1 Tax=Peribacillus alkalitolerans TaxID=1550385 RepID=UPI0013D3589C|nr:thioredoxin family protein [Peribacillus alkalitolerans]